MAGNIDRETVLFIKLLQKLPNVILRSTKKPIDLAREIQDMDMFFLTYQLIENESDRSNSHKIFEYLSTGKDIVSVDIETYRETGLIIMSGNNNDSELTDIFKTVKSEIKQYNAEPLIKERINYSLKNSIFEQLNRIEVHLSYFYNYLY